MRNTLLALLAEGPKHGLLLKEEFEAIFGDVWPPVNVGQIYTTLQRLQEAGLVDGEEVEQQGRRNKVIYRLTGAGLEELAGWFENEPGPTRFRDEFFLKLVMASRTGRADPFEIIDRRRAAYMMELRSLDAATDAAEKTDSGVGMLLAEGAALRLQADLKWLDLCEQRLTEGELK